MTNTATTTKAVKVTKRDNFNALLDFIPEDRQDLRDFVAHELELLDKKNKANASKPTKAQREGAEFDEKVLTAMVACHAEHAELRPSALVTMASLADETGNTPHVQKIAASLRRLEKAGKVEKDVKAGASYYRVAGYPTAEEKIAEMFPPTTDEVEDEPVMIEE